MKQRVENLSQSIDRDDLAKVIVNNTNMSKQEVDKTVEQYMNLIDNAHIEVEKQIDNLEMELQKAVQEWKELKHKALVAADKAADAAARSALISFSLFCSGLYYVVPPVLVAVENTRKSRYLMTGKYQVGNITKESQLIHLELVG